MIGAGPAGLTAAYRLRQRGCRRRPCSNVKPPRAAGPTPSITVPGHWVDTGAGWLASFYPDTLALLDELGQRHLLSPMQLRGGGDLRLDGAQSSRPPTRSGASSRPTCSARSTRRGSSPTWHACSPPSAAICASISITTRQTALEELRTMGEAARDRIVRPNFEGPFFARLEDMSGALVRSWLRALSIGTFFHVDGGMDAPWRHLADLLDARTGVEVARIGARRRRRGRAHRPGTPSATTAAVVAVPAPVAVAARGCGSDRPDVARRDPLRAARPAVRRPPGRRSGTQRASTCSPTISSPPSSSGPDGSARGGRCPTIGHGHWCALRVRRASAAARADPSTRSQQRLWAAATPIDPRLFRLDSADVVQLIRWRHAVPDVGPGLSHPARPASHNARRSCSPATGWCNRASREPSGPATPPPSHLERQ